MDISRIPFIDNALSKTEVYTNLQGLQSINMEKDRDQALKKVAQQFESLFVNMMTKSMRQANAVFEKDSPFNSTEANFYRDMLDQQRALTLSHGRGLGIADAMYRQMSRNYGQTGTSGDNLSPLSGGERGSTRLPNVNIPDHPSGTMPAAKAQSSVDAVERSAFATSPQEFVEKVIPYAKKAAKALGVDHLLLVAQSALETGWGKHILNDKDGRSSFNFFNIKTGGDWGSGAVSHATLEFKDGKFSPEQADFRAYANVAESFTDYHDFIRSSARYAKAVDVAADPQQYIQELQNAGYATDPRYSEKVLSVYQQINAFVDSLPGRAIDEAAKTL